MNRLRPATTPLPASLLGVLLAYVLVVQTILAPLHALAATPLAAGHGLADICAVHEGSEPGGAGSVPADPGLCCEMGCAPDLAVWSAPLRGAGVRLMPPRLIGMVDRFAVAVIGAIPPERLSGARHPPRAPPFVPVLL